MNNDPTGDCTNHPRLLQRYEWTLAMGWTVVIVVLLAINIYHERQQAKEIARTQARSNYQRDVIYRHWNIKLKTVYVPVTDAIKPNPYLADIPGRDVTTTTGQKLTLVNPAYMTRLVFDLAAKNHDIKGHITSLKPIRPENAPDSWEAEALRSFEQGEQEASSIENLAGRSYLRLMRPLNTEQECLTCHGTQGYRVGDIRGGISVAVPMEPLWNISRRKVITSAASFAILWFAGLSVIFIGAGRLRHTMRQRDRAEREIYSLNQDLMAQAVELEAANQELEAFCATVSHDLRTPLTVISGYCQIVKTLSDKNFRESCINYTEIIYKSAMRMEKLVTTHLDFSQMTRNELIRCPVDLSAMAEEIAAELRSADPGRRVTFRISEGITVNGDEALLRVVMHNLLGNAWKYTGTRDGALIEFGVTEQQGKTVCFVRDNGIGFDVGEADGIFEAFRRLSNVSGFQGNGIGLATVKRIITRHGGHIWCEGDIGSGASFFFNL